MLAGITSLIIGLAGACSESVQASPLPVVQEQRSVGPLVTLLPELAHAPAPAWLQPGLRLVYSTGSSSGSGGPAGNGFTEFDVAGMDESTVALSLSIYNNLMPGEAPHPHGIDGVLVAPGAGSDLWVNPTVLKRLKDRNKDGLMIYRMPYEAMGKKRPSVWIHTAGAKGTSLYIYEEATGLMLHTSSKSGNGEDTDPGTVLAQTTLVAMRQLQTPWMRNFSAAKLAAHAPLQFAGTTTTVIPGGIPISGRTTVSYDLKEHGGNWVKFNVSSATGSPAIHSQWGVVIGPASYGPMWIPPKDLALLQTGQELDRDPITQVVISVGRMIRTGSGKSIVVITSVNPLQRVDFGYDLATGSVDYLTLTDKMGPATIQTSLQRVE